MKFVCFWEGRIPPAYMTLCVTSWANYIDINDIVVLNHRNVTDYIGDCVNLSQLQMYSFAKQSDIASAYFLNKFGGIFLDVDTILTSEKSRDFFEIPTNSEVLKYAGNNATGGVHIGILTANPNSKPVLHWSNELLSRVPKWEKDNSWDYVGNSIIEPFLKSPDGMKYQFCYDVTKNKITPENQLTSSAGIATSDPKERYEQFWFQQHDNSDELLSAYTEDNGGIICLHNSWTPDWYADRTLEELKNGKELLSLFLQCFARWDLFDEVERLLKNGSVR